MLRRIWCSTRLGGAGALVMLQWPAGRLADAGSGRAWLDPGVLRGFLLQPVRCLRVVRFLWRGGGDLLPQAW